MYAIYLDLENHNLRFRDSKEIFFMMVATGIPQFTTVQQVVSRAQALSKESTLPDFLQRICEFKRSVESFARSTAFLSSEELDRRKISLKAIQALILEPTTTNEAIVEAFWKLPEQVRQECSSGFASLSFLQDSRVILPIIQSQLQWVEKEIPRMRECFLGLLRVKGIINELNPETSDIYEMWWEAKAEQVGLAAEMHRRIDMGEFVGRVNSNWRFTNQQMVHLADGREMDAHFSFDRRYILTQVPRQNTVASFWKMIQEQTSSTIVMLNEMYEHADFAGYFPTQRNTPSFFGDVQITLLEEKEAESTTQLSSIHKRLFSLSSSEMENRVITHLHYRYWADGAGTDKIRISKLVDLINQSQQGLEGPVTIHCGAGMGRTGTFAVILKLAQDHQAGIQNLSIRDSVSHLRDFNTGRGGGMVNEEQYLFCHTVLQYRIGNQL